MNDATLTRAQSEIAKDLGLGVAAFAVTRFIPRSERVTRPFTTRRVARLLLIPPVVTGLGIVGVAKAHDTDHDEIRDALRAVAPAVAAEVALGFVGAGLRLAVLGRQQRVTTGRALAYAVVAVGEGRVRRAVRAKVKPEFGP